MALAAGICSGSRLTGTVGDWLRRICEDRRNEALIYRLYAKASEKRRDLPDTAEAGTCGSGIAVSLMHLIAMPEKWFASCSFCPKHRCGEELPRYRMKE